MNMKPTRKAMNGTAIGYKRGLYMNLRDYAMHQRQETLLQDYTPAPQNPNTPAHAPKNNPIAAAQAIINHHNLNHEISKGCRLQILNDLERKENPYKLLLYAAEAIGRLDNQGDTFFSEVQNKIIEVWGRDISEGSPDMI